MDECGRVAPSDVAAALREDTALVIVGLREQRGRHRAGRRRDRRGRACARRARCTSMPCRPRAGCRWMPPTSASMRSRLAGHKLGAPKGTGVLAVRGRVPLEPLLHGGGQERGRRSGTEDVAGAVGFATALELAEAERAETSVRVAALRDAFIARVLATRPERTADRRPRAPPARARRASPSRGRAARPCCSNSSAAASSPRADRRAPPAATSPRTCCSRWASPAEVAQTAVRFTFPHDADAPAARGRRRGRRIRRGRPIRRVSIAARTNRAGDASRPPRSPSSCPASTSRPYAAEALESLQRADARRDWTAILIDDESTDGTADLFARRGGRGSPFPRRPPRLARAGSAPPATPASTSSTRRFSGSSMPTTCSRRPRSSASWACSTHGQRLRRSAPTCGCAPTTTAATRSATRAALGRRRDRPRAARHDDRRAPRRDRQHRRVVQGQPRRFLASGPVCASPRAGSTKTRWSRSRCTRGRGGST